MRHADEIVTEHISDLPDAERRLSLRDDAARLSNVTHGTHPHGSSAASRQPTV